MAGATGAPVSYFTQPFLNNFANTAGSSGTTQSTGASQNGGPLVPMPQVTYTPASSQPASNAYTATTQQPTSGWNINTAASQGLQSSMANTARGQNFYSPAMANAYMNPYQQNVIGGLQQSATQNYQTMANQLGAEATRAGAFGGSRHGVAQGQMAADVQRDLNQQIGNMMYSGYNNALSQAQTDQNMRMGAANQLANLSNLGFGMGQQINNQMMVQGAMQQALQQQAMDKAAQQYTGYQQSPYQALSAMTSAVSGTPYPQSSTQTSTQNTQRGLFDYLALLA